MIFSHWKKSHTKTRKLKSIIITDERKAGKAVFDTANGENVLKSTDFKTTFFTGKLRLQNVQRWQTNVIESFHFQCKNNPSEKNICSRTFGQKHKKKRKIVHKGRDRESDLRLKIKWSSYAGVNEVSLVALADEVRSDFLGGLVGFTARVRHGFGNEGDDDRLVRHVHA